MFAFDTTPVIARLQAKAPLLKGVYGAAEYAAVEGSGLPTPSAYVLSVIENGTNTPASQNGVYQVSADVAVVYAVRNYRAIELGQQAVPDLVAVAKQCREALISWRKSVDGDWPPPGYDQVQGAEWIKGQRLAYDKATVWWQDIFRIRYWSRT